jgi:hypothetical protein
MNNKVVLASGLILYRGSGDCLAFDGLASYITPYQQAFDTMTTSVLAYDKGFDGYLFDNRGNGGTEYVIISSTGKWLIGGGITAVVDGVPIVNNVTPVDFGEYMTVVMSGSSIPAGIIGSRYTIANFLLGEICSVVGVSSGSTIYNYIQNGDFGDATLIDHSGSNDGTINGATWWKKYVDQFFDDWVVYNSQLPETPVEFQDVTRVDIYSPYTNDPLWGNYDENWLVVTDQARGAVAYGYRNNLKLNLALEL